MVAHEDQPVANPDRTKVHDEDPKQRLDTEPTGTEQTAPLPSSPPGKDPKDQPDPHDQPWRTVADEVKQAVEEADGPLDE